MDFRHLIVTCLFSMLRLSFETQKIKENYAIFLYIICVFSLYKIDICQRAQANHYPKQNSL